MADLDRIIRNGILETQLDGNSKDIVNLLRIVIGGSSGTSAIHLSPGGTPTGIADGISFGDDVQIHRGDDDTLKISASGTPLFDMSTGRIIDVGDPIGAQDAATKAWVEAGFAVAAHNHDADTVFNAGTVPHEYGGLELDVSAFAGVALIDGGATAELKYNMSAVTSPGTTDDIDGGYSIGSRWLDTTANKEYVCLDNTDDAAVWVETTTVAGAGATQLSELTDVGTAPSTQNFFLASPSSGGPGTYNGRLIAAADLPNHSAALLTSGVVTHERGGLEEDVSGWAGLPHIVSGLTVELKMNFTASLAPDADDDSGDGYSVGSRWINVVTDKEYVCLDITPANAVWLETTIIPGAGVSELVDLSDVGGATDSANQVLATPNGGTGLYSGRLLVSADIPNLAASKITSGAFAVARIPNLPATIITSGVFDNAQISEVSVTQHEAALAIAMSQLTGTLTHEQGGLEADISAYGGYIRVAGGVTTEVKTNDNAVADPTANEDNLDGYVVGSRWINTTADKEFVCLDATSSSAIWVETTAGASSAHSGLTGLGADDHTQYLLTAGTRASTGVQEFLGINFTNPVEKVISGGSIGFTQGLVTVDTEGDAATDDLHTITGGSTGNVLILYPENSARSVVIKHSTGNINTFDGEDIILDNTDYMAFLLFDGSNWKVISSIAGGGGGGGGSDYFHWDTTYTEFFGDSSTNVDSLATAGLSTGYGITVDPPATFTNLNNTRLLDYELETQGSRQFTIASVDTANNRLTLVAHGFRLYDTVRLSSTGTLPTGLFANTVYWVIKHDDDNFELATSRLNAEQDQATGISTTGSGTLSVYLLNSPQEVMPSDYADPSNVKLWKLQPRSDLMIFQYHFFDGTPLTTGLQFMMTCPCDMHVERIYMSSEKDTGDPAPGPEIDFEINLGAETGGVLAEEASGVPLSHHLVLAHPTRFANALLNLYTGDRVEIDVIDIGTGSSSVVFSDLQITIFARPAGILVNPLSSD